MEKVGGKKPMHYTQYETSMKEQGTKREMGPKQLQQGMRRREGSMSVCRGGG